MSASLSPNLAIAYKSAAAEAAVTQVQSGMRVGLGTGSTAIFATRRIAELIKTGALHDIAGFATSRATWDEATRLGIPLLADTLPYNLDVTIDGADEVAPNLDVIKGGGGALLREKIVAQASNRVIIIVDETKLSNALGTLHSLPVEVLPFGRDSQRRFLESLGARITQRMLQDGTDFHTDSGNLVLDCDFGPLSDPGYLAGRLNRRAGIVEHGLFLGLATDVIVASSTGIRRLVRSNPE
jgi:ribose 5-phosphate isomerase A